MTTTAVREFLKQVKEDEALQAELTQVLAREDKSEAVAELAESKGYQFSAEELLAEVEKRQAVLAAQMEGEELSDEELEAVAGGEFTLVSAAAFVSAVGSAASAAAAATYKIGKDTTKNW